MAANYNFVIEQGSTFYMSFQYTDNLGTIINLTNYQARISIQPTSPTGDLITYMSDNEDSNYSLLVNGDSGTITWRIPSTTTEGFTFSQAVYDFDLKAPNEVYPGSGSQIIKLLKGTIDIVAGNIKTPEPFIDKELDDDGCIICE